MNPQPVHTSGRAADRRTQTMSAARFLLIHCQPMRHLMIGIALCVALLGCSPGGGAVDACGTAIAAKQCVRFYSGGKAVKTFANPVDWQPSPYGVAVQDAAGRVHFWNGDYHVTSKEGP